MHGARTILLNSEITGTGMLSLIQINEATYGYVALGGLNTNFQGKVGISSDRSDANENCTAFVTVTDGRNLGGPLSEWSYDALSISGYAHLIVTNDVELAMENRGIHLSGPAYFAVSNNAVFSVRERITWSGLLTKQGPGTLALGGPQPYFSAGGSTAPVSGNNVLDVWEGTLRPVSATAFQGLAVVITNSAATLAVDVPASNDDGDIGQYGMLDTTWNAPLTVPGSGLTVQLRDSNGVLTRQTRLCRVPICTVNATAQAALDGKLSVDRSPSRCHVVASAGWTNNGDGSYTFAAVLERTGFMISIK